MNTIQKMPKAELHCHLDGSLPVSVIRRLAEQNRQQLKMSDQELEDRLRAPQYCQSLKEYLERFELPLSYLVSPEAFQTAAYCLMEEAALEQVMYMEIRFAPSLSVTDKMTASEIVGSVIQGIRAAEQKYEIRGNVILSFMRHEDVSYNVELFHELKGLYGQGVCAIDIAGDEAGFPTETQELLFREASKAGIPFTIHAGECGDVRNVEKAIVLGASRIGHGIALTESSRLRKLCTEKKIGIELCPTSNFQTKAVRSFDDYPIRQFMDEGMLVTVNTDNRVVSGTTLTRELELMNQLFQIDPEVVTENAIEVSFADQGTKEWMIQRITQKVNKK